MLTKTQAKVILVLLDNKGHPEWELAEYLEMEDSNLNRILKELEEMGLIFKGNIRSSRRQHAKKGIYGEIPYFLSQNLDDFRTLIREIAASSKPYDTGFLLETIDNSKYLKNMKEQFKDDLNKIINEELSKSDSPYSDPFFAKVIEPELVEELFCNLDQLLQSEISS
jgi:predicted transcriptional regulator